MYSNYPRIIVGFLDYLLDYCWIFGLFVRLLDHCWICGLLNYRWIIEFGFWIIRKVYGIIASLRTPRHNHSVSKVRSIANILLYH